VWCTWTVRRGQSSSTAARVKTVCVDCCTISVQSIYSLKVHDEEFRWNTDEGPLHERWYEYNDSPKFSEAGPSSKTTINARLGVGVGVCIVREPSELPFSLFSGIATGVSSAAQCFFLFLTLEQV